MIAEIIANLKAKDIHVAIRGGKLKVDAPTGVLTDALLALLRKNKAAILAELSPKPTGCAWREDAQGNLWFSDGTAYAPTITGGWILTRHQTRRVVEPGIVEVTP